MKRLMLIIVCLPWVVFMWANPVSVDQARQKASQFLQGQVVRKARRAAPSAQQLKMAAKGRDDTYYIFNAGDNGGYVVVSGEDATEEILGYSNSGTIDPDNMPCGMHVLLDGYTDQIRFLRENGIKREQNSQKKNALRKNANYYPYLPDSYTIDEGRRSYFDQGGPYNESIHKIDGKPALTGCTATAIAGLMFAHQWPKATISAIPSYKNWKINSLLSTDWKMVEGAPANTQIDWKNIEASYDGTESLEKKAAIASLMRLTSISVKTIYVPDDPETPEISERYGEANFEDEVDEALKKYFAYDEKTMWAERYYETHKKNPIDWDLELRRELWENGPVLYSGENKHDSPKYPKGKHTFLLEGYQGKYFIVNFGWGGQHHDEMYLLSVIEAEDNDKLIAYNSDQSAVFYVRPIPHVEVEVTSLRFDNVISTRPSLDGARLLSSPEQLTFTDTNLRGSITFHNKGENKSWKFFFLQLRDVEKADTTFRVISKSLLPDESYTYNFSFSDLTIGHHYVLSSLDLFGDEFYQSTELLCVEDTLFSENDNDIGNENLVSYEYWFDDDFAHREIVSLSNNKAVIRASLETDQLTIGVHRLNFRVKRNDGNYSAVTTSLFLKRPSAQSSQMEYWFDDNFDQRDCISINNSEEEQAFALDLCDDTKYPMGFHQLNMRITLKGGSESAVCSSGVFKLSTGYVSKLEYWFDGDINHSNTISCQSANNMSGFIFADDLNLSGLLPGHHRLYYRAISDDGLISSAVSSIPVMVNINYENAGEETMSSYSLIIDNDSVASSGPMDATKEVELNYTLDTENLQEGIHTLQATFWNSYGLSVTDLTSFEVVPKGYILGDVNGDGNVNITDAVCILNYILGNPSSDFIFKAADINSDTIINITDVVGVVSLILNNNSVNK